MAAAHKRKLVCMADLGVGASGVGGGSLRCCGGCIFCTAVVGIVRVCEDGRAKREQQMDRDRDRDRVRLLATRTLQRQR